jgi:hypothetical protein
MVTGLLAVLAYGPLGETYDPLMTKQSVNKRNISCGELIYRNKKKKRLAMDKLKDSNNKKKQLKKLARMARKGKK